MVFLRLTRNQPAQARPAIPPAAPIPGSDASGLATAVHVDAVMASSMSVTAPVLASRRPSTV